MALSDTTQNDLDQVVTEYEKKVKDLITKVDAAVAEMARARDKYSVAAPADASPEQVKRYNEHRKSALSIFSVADRYVATVKTGCRDLLVAVKPLHRQH